MHEAAAEPAFVPSPRRAHVTHGWLNKHSYALLLEEAERRRMHPDALTAKILDTVLIEEWTGTLLDP